MKFMELGEPENPVVILLHGGGLSWWSVEEPARLLQGRYRVVMPIIDGHGEEGETEFSGVEDSAEKLLRFIDRSCGGRVFALCGLSLGAQIAAEVLAARPEIAEYAVLESALMRTGHARGKRRPEWLVRFFYGLTRRRCFAKLRAKSLSIPDSLFEPYFRDTRRITLRSFGNLLESSGNYRPPASLQNTKAKVLILAGSRESAEIKLSAGFLKKRIPKSRLVIAQNRRRGELSIAQSGEYTQLLERWFSEPAEKFF